MAKKQKTEKVVEPLIEKDFEEVETRVVEKPLPTPKDTWEIKDRVYYLSRRQRPLSRTLKAANVYYF